ncbi:hypothetical protein JCM24511_03706 [Saitozyma sp. JCM 24511]|nr:hypothetical protein JCM24511_03706 [Saitozyma sp. JCM 24511]
MLPLIDSPSLAPAVRGLLNAAVFVLSLFLLERSADVFVDSTAVVAKRFGVPTILLAVVVSALVQNNEDLAISNILGSCTANILGSFSIGLLFSRRDAPLTLSANDAFSGRLYSSILVLLEVGVIVLGPGWTLLRHRGHAGGVGEGKSAGRWVGIVLLVGFALYVAGIWYGIKKGTMIAPEGSDSESESDTSDEDGTGDTEDEGERRDRSGVGRESQARSQLATSAPAPVAAAATPTETTALLSAPAENDTGTSPNINSGNLTNADVNANADASANASAHASANASANANANASAGGPSPSGDARRPHSRPPPPRRRPTPTWRHVALLILSMIGLTNAGALLSGTTSSLAILLGISQSTAGLSILSVATTVPEKLVAYKSARKAQAGVLVANTVGSDVFLLTLVLGVVWAARGHMPFTRGNRYGTPSTPGGGGGGDGKGDGDGGGGDAETLWIWVDLGVVLLSSVWLWFVVRAGTFKRRTGGAMIVCYIAYLVFLFAR